MVYSMNKCYYRLKENTIMKKISLLLLCLFMFVGCASEAKSFEKIGQQYVQNYYYAERKKILTELAHEDYFAYNYINNKDNAIENSKINGDKEYNENLANNIDYKYVDYEIVHRDSKEEIDRFNQLANRNFSEMVTIVLTIEKHQNNTLISEVEKQLLLVKDGVKWSILR